jgi:twitching motility protein PilT
MAEIDKLFKLMIQQNASDMHLSAGSTPYFRIHGAMTALSLPALENEAIQSLVFEILTEKQKRTFIENWELDTSYAIKGVGRFRVNVFMQRRGMGGVFRVIPEVIKSAKELGLPPMLLEMIKVPRGLVLVTGPTGSGKSTTLASLINEINLTKKDHIITIEDPIEFVHENKMSLINQREVSSHTKSFANALRAALREDPDIILVGEMRDLETIQLAMTAAETGHLVFGTLHTNNAPKTIDRIIDVFPQTQQAQVRTMLSESLRGVIAQTLFPRTDRPGRVAAFEVLTSSHAVANLIREGKTHQIPSVMQTQMAEGMMTFEYHLNKLTGEGLVDRQVADTFLGKKKKMEPSAGAGLKGPASDPSGIRILSTEDSQKPTAPPLGAVGGIKKR